MIKMAQIEVVKEQAKIEAEKELAFKELELKAQQNQASATLAVTPPPRNKDAKSPKLPSFIDEKDELTAQTCRSEENDTVPTRFVLGTPEFAAVLPLSGYGHRQSECGTKISPSKDQKGSSTPVSQSSLKKTHAMVAQMRMAKKLSHV